MDSKKQQRDKERPKRQEHRERDARERQQEDRVDRGEADDQIDPEPGEVVGEIAVEEPALLEEQVRRIAALEDDLIDDRDRVKGADDDRAELRRAH